MRIQRGKTSFFLSVLLVASFFGGGVAQANDANNWGWLNIENYVNSISDDCSAVHYDDSGVSDGKDSWDTVWLAPKIFY